MNSLCNELWPEKFLLFWVQLRNPPFPVLALLTCLVTSLPISDSYLQSMIFQKLTVSVDLCKVLCFICFDHSRILESSSSIQGFPQSTTNISFLPWQLNCFLNCILKSVTEGERKGNKTLIQLHDIISGTQFGKDRILKWSIKLDAKAYIGISFPFM